jgi:hypothetical protein
MCARRWHGTHRYDIKFTRQHGGIDILHCCNDPCLKQQKVHVAMVERTQYVSSLPRDLADLMARITAAVKNIDTHTLKRV